METTKNALAGAYVTCASPLPRAQKAAWDLARLRSAGRTDAFIPTSGHLPGGHVD
jgi:hypothetical protein